MSIGEIFLEHPRILDEIRDWFYRLTLEDLMRPEEQEEIRKRRTTAEHIAQLAARGFMHRELFPLTVTDMFQFARAALLDKEVVAYPYPFGFGMAVRDKEAQETAKFLERLHKQASDVPLEQLWNQRGPFKAAGG